MKKIYFVIIISIITAIACNDDYLEKYPLDQVSDASYWKSSNDLAMYANQFYPDLKDSNTPEQQDNGTDNNGPGVRDEYVWGESIVPTIGDGWGKSDWLGIYSCNYALDKIANIEKDAAWLQYEGEIRFFKSFYYFQKIKRYGDVPWLEHVLETNSDDLYKARDSRKTVITNMLKDLDFAIDNLPETSAEDRLTKYAALAFKVDVCLFEGTFRKYHNLGDHEAILREAVNASESIISSGLFSVYLTDDPIAEDYLNLFSQEELQGNPEGIMIQRYIKDIRMNNHVTAMLPSGKGTGYSKDFVESYLCTDGLPISLSPLYKGDTVFADEFVNRDPRMKQSIYTSDRICYIQLDGTVNYWQMPAFDMGGAPTSYAMIKGYSPLQAQREQGRTTLDDFIFRYGKVLISYAEAKAELGECTQQVLDESLNLLRDRGRMPHLTVDVGFVDPYWPNWEVPVTPLINEIRRERRIELCSEGCRWDDLVRWKAGKLLEKPKTVLGGI